MNEDPASLDRLHGIVPPDPVPVWPPPAGWWVLLALVLVVLGGVALRLLRRHRADAYRRAALEEAGKLVAAADLVALLKRAALSAWPREEVASLSGEAWIEWLGRAAGSPVPVGLRPLLLDTPYLDRGNEAPTELRDFVAGWIRSHRR